MTRERNDSYYFRVIKERKIVARIIADLDHQKVTPDIIEQKILNKDIRPRISKKRILNRLREFVDEGLLKQSFSNEKSCSFSIIPELQQRFSEISEVSD